MIAYLEGLYRGILAYVQLHGDNGEEIGTTI